MGPCHFHIASVRLIEISMWEIKQIILSVLINSYTVGDDLFIANSETCKSWQTNKSIKKTHQI